MELKLINDQGKGGATVSASDAAFRRDFNEALVHQLVVACQANARSARAQTRGDLTRSHRKPWRQKGTGRARAGFSGSPLWRGGGKIFPSSPDENFSQKVNRKMYRAGMASILSQLARDGRLSVVEDFKVDQPKTKLLAQKVKALGLDQVVLITVRWTRTSPFSRNPPNVLVLEAGHADPVTLVSSKNVLVTRKAVAKLEELFA
jgi:large subunit ribosomal protein L4